MRTAIDRMIVRCAVANRHPTPIDREGITSPVGPEWYRAGRFIQRRNLTLGACRPEGAECGAWVKPGWACATEPVEPLRQPELDDHFPEVLLHGAAPLKPGLKVYHERMPRSMSHYGGDYTMTIENWPLIGPAGPKRSDCTPAASRLTFAVSGRGVRAV